ncbi:hypothetical protein F5Y16DRAFT_398903 [Xylariaceae sp. FL0255]|nr:hypothetical protein F5Y16DRAFT_398903 [Xylariaceae sp. FL0255]
MGIPPIEPKTPDYYNDLGVSQSASKRDIKKAFDLLALKYHPDKNKAQQKDPVQFRKIREEYELLEDETSRATSDRTYFEVQDAWTQYRTQEKRYHQNELRRKAQEEAKRQQQEAEAKAEAQRQKRAAEQARKAAEAERLRKQEEQRRRDAEAERLKKQEEQRQREAEKAEKIRQAAERSREAEKRGWEERQRAAKERIHRDKEAEAAARSEEVARRARLRQEIAARERFEAAKLKERLEASRRVWEDLRQRCDTYNWYDENSNGDSRTSQVGGETPCDHPPFKWPKRPGRTYCGFCGILRWKWALICPDCGMSACPDCKRRWQYSS